MDYRKQLVDALQEYYSDAAEITIKVITKTNGVEKTGIIVREDTVAPILYCDNLVEQLELGEITIHEATNYLTNLIQKETDTRPYEGVEKLIMNWDKYAKNNVYPVLVNTEMNQTLLEDLITSQVLDLSAYYVIRIEGDTESVASVKVTKDLFEKYGVSMNELHMCALDNMKKDGYQLKNIRSVISSMMGANIESSDIDSISECEMMIIHNRRGLYSAACLINQELLISMLPSNKNYWIIPSSIHEILLVPMLDNKDLNSLNHIIADINKNELQPEDVLSNHAYVWKDNMLSICV